MRLTCTQISRSLDVAATKTSQAARPAILKVATLMLDWPAETMAELAAAVEEVKLDRERAIQLRETMLEGRANRMCR